MLMMLALGFSAWAGDQRAQTNYMLHCSGCHMADGTGSVEHGIPNMNGAVGHFLRLAEGRHFLIQVPGTSQSPMGDAATAELLNWMVFALSREEVPADFRPYTTEEVKRLRQMPLDDPAAVRAGIVRRLGELGFKID